MGRADDRHTGGVIEMTSPVIIAMLVWVGSAKGDFPTAIPNFATLADCRRSIPTVQESYRKMQAETAQRFISAECVVLPPSAEAATGGKP